MATLIFVLLVVIAIMAIGWNDDRVKMQSFKSQALSRTNKTLALANDRNAKLEAEIQRIRKIPLTQPQEKRDDSTIKAKSSADVRRLTEAAFGLQPEIGAQNEDE
jgi:C4-dicarboxylate-specific signal transduction histidine kinase